MSDFKTITGLPGQTAFDVALQEYGDIAGLRWLMNDNQQNGYLLVISPNVTGFTLNIRKNTFINKKVVDYYKKPVTTY